MSREEEEEKKKEEEEEEGYKGRDGRSSERRKRANKCQLRRKQFQQKRRKRWREKGRYVTHELTVVQYVILPPPPPPHTHTHSLQSTEVVCEERKEVEEVGAESEGGDEGESHSNNRLRKRTTQVARTRDESDEEEESRGSEEEDEEEWKHLQKSVPKQKNKLDLASNESHPVHAPFFPEVCPVM